MQSSKPLPSVAPDRERGATIVEMAMVLPLLLLIIIGIAELGLAFKGHLTASYASREGARVAAFVGDAPDADCQAVTAIASLLGNSINDLDRIEIFKADQGGNQLSGQTNVITYQGGDPQLCNSPDDALDSWTRTESWPSTSRNVIVGPTQQLDIVGVRVMVDQDWVTNFGPFTGSLNLNESTIMRLEPEAYE